MLRLSLLLFALLAAGCYDDAGVPAPKNDPLPEANLSLPDLSARCGDTPVRIVQDIVVAGRVTTSDEAGNFFRSVVLQEDGTGVELMAGLDDLFRVYPPGCRIAVRLQGLAMCRRFGVVQIGTMPAAGDYAVEAIGVRALLDRYVACETVDVLRPVPRIVAFRRTCARHVRLPGADRGSDAASVGRGSDGLEMGRLSAVRGPGRKQDRHLYEHLCPVCGFGISEGAGYAGRRFAVRQCRVDRKILYD